MRTLPDNYCRCEASKCEQKDQCARFTSPATKEVLVADFSLMVKSVAQCNMFEENTDDDN